ncbi:helix-turn-helix transcriptional regulator [Halobacterium zhouii]|uniref:helix-turn-helix transcriptional regulator n=1 Tax=Halobacterium zhouii TaxID=2902624 RepID=UPI001E374C10|nr:GntR family transcriptional regulator [Halobacterium zhouii]
MVDGDVASTVELLARRAELLRSLRAGAESKRDLVDALSVSRSTVDRAIRRLESHGFVARCEGAVEITLKGRLALTAFESFAADVSSLDAAGAVLERMGASSRMDVSMLRNADVVEPDRVTPNRPAGALLEHLQNATSVRGFTNVVLPSYVDVFRENILNHDVPVDLVVTPDVLEELVANYRDTLDQTLETECLDLLCANRTLEYSLLVVDIGRQTVVGALVYDEQGVFGVLENDDDRAVEWATDLLDELRSNADRVPM